MRFQTPTKWEMFLDGWRNFLNAWDLYDCEEYKEFWEALSMGWMDEYIYPYDDPFCIKISKERKLRLGV